MAGVPTFLLLLRAEHLADVVRVAAHRVQELPLAGGFVVRHGRLHRVPGVVQLVAVPKMSPALVGLYHGVVHVQVAVFLLCSGDEVDNLVDESLQLLVRVGGKRMAGGLDPFGHVPGAQNPWRVRLARLPVQPVGLSTSGLPADLVLGRQGDRAIGLQPRPPERVVDRDACERYGRRSASVSVAHLVSSSPQTAPTPFTSPAQQSTTAPPLRRARALPHG